MRVSPFGLTTKEAQPIPLTKVQARGKITGRGARVKLIQIFSNQEDKAIEAVYKFPLPQDSALCGFKAIIYNKIIEAAIEEKDKAFEDYDKALSEGHGAFLLDEERPNIFTISLGNVIPRASVRIEIDYITFLEAHGSEARFFLPTLFHPGTSRQSGGYKRNTGGPSSQP